MKSIGKIIKSRRLELGMTMKELSVRVGVSEGTISRWESGEIKNMRISAVSALAKALVLSPSAVMGWGKTPDDMISALQLQKTSLLREITAGQSVYAHKYAEEYLPSSADMKANYSLRVQGDSMINAGIRDGDIVYIQTQDNVENGQIAAVVIDNSVTLKRVYKGPDFLQLVPENPKYAPMVFNGKNCSAVKILGRAIAVLNKL